MPKAHVKITISRPGTDASFEGEVEYKTAYNLQEGRPMTQARAKGDTSWVYHEDCNHAVTEALLRQLSFRYAAEAETRRQESTEQ